MNTATLDQVLDSVMHLPPEQRQTLVDISRVVRQTPAARRSLQMRDGRSPASAPANTRRRLPKK